jgi:hypothetical protein
MVQAGEREKMRGPTATPAVIAMLFLLAVALVVTLNFTGSRSGPTAQVLSAATQEGGQVPAFPTPTPLGNASSEADLFFLRGTTIARGSNNLPTGFYRLKSYRVDELTFSPLDVHFTPGSDSTQKVSKAWRVTVTGGPFVLRDLPPALLVDGKLAGYGQESADLMEIFTVVYDRSLLTVGATISLEYGPGDPGRTDLPEKLNFSRP